MTLILFTAGVVAALAMGVYFPLTAYLLPVGLVLTVVGVGFVVRKKGKLPRPVLLGAGLALLWLTAYGAVFQAPAEELADKTLPIEAVVYDWPWETEYGCSIPVYIGQPGERKVRGVLYGDWEQLSLKPGDRLTCTAKCTSGRLVRGEDNLLYVSRGIQIRGTIKENLVVTSAEGISLRYAPAYLAQSIRKVIHRLYPERQAAFLCAILTGDKTGLDDSDQNNFNRTGLGHVVVISGLHVTFLMGLFTLVWKKRGIGSFVGITTLLLLFCLMTGSAPGTVRAVVLCSIALLGECLGRESDPLTSLCAGLLILLSVNPYGIANAGLQFSFLATLGILLFGRHWAENWTKKIGKSWRQWIRPLVDVIAISFGAMLFTVPLSALYFGRFSLISPVANLCTSWSVALIFLGGLLSVLVGAVWLTGGLLLAKLIGLLIDFFYKAAELFSGLPLASITTDSLPYAVWLWAAYFAVLVCLFLPKEFKKRGIVRRCCAGGIAAGFALSVALTFASVRTAPLTFAALDVGQGQSVALWSKGQCALIDCGGSVDPGDEAATYLQARGRMTLDYLILTHYHDDHAEGIPELMGRVQVKELLLPDVDKSSSLRQEIEAAAKEQGSTITYITETTTVSLGNGSITLMPPEAGADDEKRNERCMAVLCTLGDWNALLTGDMPIKEEKELLKRETIPDLSLLVVGHHGSKHSTGEKFLDAVTPETAVISVGYNNYGHPTPETLERLSKRKITVYRTDEEGTVTIPVYGEAET